VAQFKAVKDKAEERAKVEHPQTFKELEEHANGKITRQRAFLVGTLYKEEEDELNDLRGSLLRDTPATLDLASLQALDDDAREKHDTETREYNDRYARFERLDKEMTRRLERTDDGDYRAFRPRQAHKYHARLQAENRMQALEKELSPGEFERVKVEWEALQHNTKEWSNLHKGWGACVRRAMAKEHHPNIAKEIAKYGKDDRLRQGTPRGGEGGGGTEDGVEAGSSDSVATGATNWSHLRDPGTEWMRELGFDLNPWEGE